MNSDVTLLEQYIDRLWLEKGLSRNTLDSYHSDLEAFRLWLDGKAIVSVRREDLLRYLSDRMSKGIKSRSTARALSFLRGLYRYLLRENKITEDPTLQIENPKLGRPLPDTLTETEVEKLLAAPNIDSAIGFRDRTMLEVLYACGLKKPLAGYSGIYLKRGRSY